MDTFINNGLKVEGYLMGCFKLLIRLFLNIIYETSKLKDDLF